MILREMLVDDLEQVMEIEEELFSVPWTKEGFLTFLMKDNAMFLVVEEKGQILGYCGLLTVLDEGDVTNVAVRKERQREGIAIAKRNGVYKGRKPAQLPPDFDVLYARYLCRELNKTQLAAAVGVSRPTLERLLREYKT